MDYSSDTSRRGNDRVHVPDVGLHEFVVGRSLLGYDVEPSQLKRCPKSRRDQTSDTTGCTGNKHPLANQTHLASLTGQLLPGGSDGLTVEPTRERRTRGRSTHQTLPNHKTKSTPGPLARDHNASGFHAVVTRSVGCPDTHCA